VSQKSLLFLQRFHFKETSFWKIHRSITTDVENIKDVTSEVYLAIVQGKQFTVQTLLCENGRCYLQQAGSNDEASGRLPELLRARLAKSRFLTGKMGNPRGLHLGRDQQ
jgi:hypothetical protein